MILIGTGNVALEYAKVLDEMCIRFATIGNTIEGCARFARMLVFNKIKHCEMLQEGKVSDSALFSPEHKEQAIVAIPINAQYDTVKKLIGLGVKRILVEKPGVMYSIQARGLAYLAKQYGVEIRVAYNRRFYQSARVAREAIQQDGLRELWFCFGEDMEWVAASSHPKNIREKWMLANSSHVIDLAKWLSGGWSISTHDTPGIFSGHGFSPSGAQVSYMTNYRTDKRWSIQFITGTGERYKLAPLETLSRFVNERWVTIAETTQPDIKAGFSDMVSSFLRGGAGIPTIQEQLELIQEIDRIGGFRE